MARGPVALTPEEIAAVKAMVVYQDEAIIALDKPSGLSSQGGRIKAHTLDDLLAAFAKASGNRPRLVHRLDRDTSGVILTARTKPAAAALGKALMDRRVRKTYLAVVTPGAPDPREGTIESALRRVEQGREAHMRVCPDDHPDAEAAFTRYRTLGAGEGAALVELSPHTGRMHQLRVHLASIGRPIAGDVRYGGALMLGGEPCGRLMLHAFSIQFRHPDGRAMRISAPVPPDFAQTLERLGLPTPKPPDAPTHG
ncbi:MAG: RluA family pseudouridine synthase [Proteobacteria bacterium]|nr:RluA family pseudouridine synthase [Pseudomonadota bacterium]